MKVFFLILFWCATLIGTAPSIGIFTYQVPGVEPWDSTSLERGLTGSEEAVVHMAKQLAQLGYQVTVWGDPPEGSSDTSPEANPRYRPLSADRGERIDCAIAWRNPRMAQVLKKRANKVCLWPHDPCSALQPQEEIEAFDEVLWLSHWQRLQWCSVNPAYQKFQKIYGNGVALEQFKTVQPKKNPYSCIYASNYGQGLEVLLDCWPMIHRLYPDATLDIYYGWQHWGFLTQEKEDKLKSQIQRLSTKGVREHGRVGHSKLHRAFEEASVWTYPCTGVETFCITALKAQLAGCLPVIIEGSGLQETVCSGLRCAQKEDYLFTLIQAFKQAEKLRIEERESIATRVREHYTWNRVALDWQKEFQQLLVERPRICLNMIVKDESAVIQRCLRSVKPYIDYWVIVDTGSTDGTQQLILEALKDVPGELHERPWVNFSHNRNEALQLSLGKGDYALFIDADETLAVEASFRWPHLDKEFYFSDVKTLSSQFQRVLLAKLCHPWRWEGALHEQIVSDEPCLGEKITGAALLASFLDGRRSQDPEKWKKDALVLEKQLIEDPDDVRAMSFLAQTYYCAKEYDAALKWFRKRSQMGGSEEEVFWSLYSIGKIHELLRKPPEEVIASYVKAFEYRPSRAEPLFRLANFFFEQNQFFLGYAVAKQAVQLPMPDDLVYIESPVYSFGARLCLANCAAAAGRLQEAIPLYRSLLESSSLDGPSRQEAEQNLSLVLQMASKNP